MATGTVKWFNDSKGFRFITRMTAAKTSSPITRPSNGRLQVAEGSAEGIVRRHAGPERSGRGEHQAALAQPAQRRARKTGPFFSGRRLRDPWPWAGMPKKAVMGARSKREASATSTQRPARPVENAVRVALAARNHSRPERGLAILRIGAAGKRPPANQAPDATLVLVAFPGIRLHAVQLPWERRVAT